VGRVLSGVFDRTCSASTAPPASRSARPRSQHAWPAHALLVACSDGIETRWKPELLRPVLGRDPTLAAALLVRDHCRGRDDATVAVCGARTDMGTAPIDPDRNWRRRWRPAARSRTRCARSSRKPTAACGPVCRARRAGRAAAQATELKSRFLAYMSHEFRTPINSIRSIARLLIDRVDGPLTEEQERQVGFIQHNATEFAEMVDDLLDLAKVEAGRVEISPAWFEMVDLFSALRGMFKPVLTNPDGEPGVRGAAGRPQALHRRPQAVADPAQLHLQRAEVHPRGEVRVCRCAATATTR
jgi:signal transduction histidine kinase